MSDKLLEIKLEDLFEAGVHFGHKAHRWNPKMEPYIYGERDGAHIIDLRQTVGLLRNATKILYEVVRKNGRVLFVGTAVQASDIVAQAAAKCGQYYINHRWLGGTLTNWTTVSKSIKTLEKLEINLAEQRENQTYTKKELLELERECDKLQKYLGGIRNMGGLPNLVIVLDTRKDRLAIHEAIKLRIPVIAILDTNSNPDNISYPIPGNDDAARSIQYYCDVFSSSALSGIEDALANAGVDITKISGDKSAKGGKRIIKYKHNRKLSSDASEDSDQAESDEFESNLEDKHVKHNSNLAVGE